MVEDKIVWASHESRFFLIKKCTKQVKEGRRGKQTVNYSQKNFFELFDFWDDKKLFALDFEAEEYRYNDGYEVRFEEGLVR